MSERKFSVGDRVRIVRSSVSERVGTEAMVIGFQRGPVGLAWNGLVSPHEECCVLDLPRLPGLIGNVSYPHRFLEPIYDGNERVSWSDCAWQPKKVAA